MNIHSIYCTENVFTIQDFWATCACLEKQSFSWNFHCIEYISYHSRFLSKSALTMKYRVCPEIFYCIQYTFYTQDFWATCVCHEFAVLNIYFLQWRAVRFVTGKALSLSKPNLRVYELNGVAQIHHSTGCLQNDYCLCFLSHVIICYTHVGTMAILHLKKSNV